MIALLAITAAGAIYLALALLQTVRFAMRRVPKAARTPSVTILKPLYGNEPGLYESLVTFCDQDYPDFEIVFCLHEREDAATPVVERVKADFPNHRIRIVYGDNPNVANPKIANLAKPGAEPKGDIIILADSDIWVDRDYINAIVASFTTDRTGAVCCLYGGVPNESLASRLGAMHSEEEFGPSVLVANLGKMTWCLGATMAVRRDALEAIGGIEALGADLADDYALGELVTDRGFTVELSRYVVHTTFPYTTLAKLWAHELRWSRTNFRLTPWAHIFTFVMYATPFAILYALLARTPLALGLLLLVALLRLGIHIQSREIFDKAQRDQPWLIPVRDMLSLAVWAAGLVTRTVNWRGARHRM